MKLLGWMHRKFRQNSSEPLKDFVIGQPSLDDQQYCPRPNYSTRSLRQTQRDHPLRNSFTGLEAARVEEEDFEEESSTAITELFHGFLAIGTLGSDPITNDPATPTFSFSIENITEKETEVTENELKLINDELERVLGAETKEDGCNDSSGRNSHVSIGRSSHGSTITLSGKPLEGAESNNNGSSVCPLQGYLFGSSFELPETTAATKKENRTSLAELFQRSKMEEYAESKYERCEKRTEKEADKNAMHIMKKILKRKMLHASSRSSNGGTGGTVDSTYAETKLHKILHMFHRKVHPESSTTMPKAIKPQKEIKNNVFCNRGHNNVGQLPSDEGITTYPQRAFPKESIRRYKSQSNPPQFTISGSESNGNREYWIKTDADYLVLEL